MEYKKSRIFSKNIDMLCEYVLNNNGLIPTVIDGKKNSLYSFLMCNKERIIYFKDEDYRCQFLCENVAILKENGNFLIKLALVVDYLKNNENQIVKINGKRNSVYNFLSINKERILSLSSSNSDAYYICNNVKMFCENIAILEKLSKILEELKIKGHIKSTGRSYNYLYLMKKVDFIFETCLRCFNSQNDSLTKLEEVCLELLCFNQVQKRIKYLQLKKQNSFDNIDKKINDMVENIKEKKYE